MNSRPWWGSKKRTKIWILISKRSNSSTSRKLMKTSMKRGSRPKNRPRRIFKHRHKALKILRALKTFHRRRRISSYTSLLFKTQSRRASQGSQRQLMALSLEALVNKTYLTMLTLIESSSMSTISTRTVCSTLSGRTTFPAYGRTRTLLESYERLPHQLAAAALRTSLVARLLTAERTTSICPSWVSTCSNTVASRQAATPFATAMRHRTWFKIGSSRLQMTNSKRTVSCSTDASSSRATCTWMPRTKRSSRSCPRLAEVARSKSTLTSITRQALTVSVTSALFKSGRIAPAQTT